ncbi:DNA-binding protein [Rhodococcus sp. 14-2686-1-2]|nr:MULTISPECIES: DNA-binding protein [Rhodococcus]OZF00600.1 DNA-binding protein [Rhodococcus sp. 15-1189-1-1a]OZF14482.1 DNA-binding protein [Rhodococcus sp. 14-2686-1-2]
MPTGLRALATPKEAAEFLRTTPGALAQDRYRGRGPRYVKRGSRVLYSWEELHRFVSDNTMQSTDGRPGAA